MAHPLGTARSSLDRAVRRPGTHQAGWTRARRAAQAGAVANMIGLRPRRPGADGDGAQDRLVGPLHAVEGVAGRAAAQEHTEVQALCGEWVQVVAVEDVPDDTGLCAACQYGT
jgi:hypothetical protein